MPYIAPSLGGVESLIEQPAIISYWDQGTEGRRKVGIKDNLVRFSCGVEDFDDIKDDMFEALEHCDKPPRVKNVATLPTPGLV